MPTYEYRCTQCNHEFEAIQSMKDDPLTECNQCKGLVKRIISRNVGIAFKGSGFYATDSQKSSAAPKPAAPSKKP